MRRFVVWSIIGLSVLSVPVVADSTLLKFDGGIGVVPVSSATSEGLATPNVVRGVSPGGQPWVIDRLTATITTDGRIQVDGRGLLLAGGDGIGTAGGQSVKAVLFCGVPGSAVGSETQAVALDEAGDFVFDEALSPAPPSPCDSPVLLIVNAGGRWFAAGILKR